MAPRYDAAAICTPGLEDASLQELRLLGLKPRHVDSGLVEFPASARQLYVANLWSRTATRILVRIARFRATDFAHLEQRSAEIDWHRWLRAGLHPEFRVSCKESKLYHTTAIAERLQRIVEPVVAANSLSVGADNRQKSRQRFVVRVVRNTFTISIDSSGDPLYRRPWRSETGVAPLRPNVAAALLIKVGWRPEESLIDPFCGSGTFCIEAALLRANRPAVASREFAFQTWSEFEPGTWASARVATQNTDGAQSGTNLGAGLDRLYDYGPIAGSDMDPQVIKHAKANAERADISDFIDFETKLIAQMKPIDSRGLLIANPPYGKRLSTPQLGKLYKQLGAKARQQLPSMGFAVITTDPKLARTADRDLERIATFRNGGLKAGLYHRPSLEDNTESNNAESNKH